MIPTNVSLDAIAKLWPADTTTLAAALALKVHLAMAAFTPSNVLTVGGLVEATFQGYAPLSPTAGAQIEFLDPISGLRIVELKTPAGGYMFTVTGSTGLPQSIFGYYVTDNASAVLYGSALLPTPVPLTAIGQALELPPLRFAFLLGSPF